MSEPVLHYKDQNWYLYAAQYTYDNKTYEIEFYATNEADALLRIQKMKQELCFSGRIVHQEEYSEN